MPNPSDFIPEDQIPDNLQPVDAPVIVPGRSTAPAPPSPNPMPPFFSGSMPPQLQHDTVFVGTEIGSPRIPKESLMPFGIQSNPSTNAAIQSTATKVAQVVVSKIPPPPTPTPAKGDSLIHGEPIWWIDDAFVWLRDDFIFINQGSITGNFVSELPWNFSAVQSQHESGRFPNFGTIVIPNNGTANQVSFMGPQPLVSGTGYWPLFDYPSWKLVWNFSLGRQYYFNGGGSPVIGFSTAQTSLYIGLAASPLNNPPSIGSAPGRPPFFVGVRFDTDTTAPSIGDTKFVLEAVANNNGMITSARNNTQGNTFSTGITPSEGVPYRLEIVCTTAGQAQLLFTDGTTVVTATLNVPKWSTGASNNSYNEQGGIGLASLNFMSSTAQPPTGQGSFFTIAGTGTAFDGTHTVLGVANSFILDFFFPTNPTVSTTSTISGFPAMIPWIAFGNDTSASPVNNSKALYVDFFSFVWNPGVNGGSGTPNSTLSRYF